MEPKTFPTASDEQGYFFETEEDETLGIKTKVLPNDNKTKTVVLGNGKTAVMRELTGRDTKNVNRFMGGDKEKYMLSSIAIATTIEGSPETFEFFEALKWKDSNKLIAMFGDLNF